MNAYNLNFRSHSKDFYSANSVQKSDDTNRASTISETVLCAENVYALTKFCKNFYGHNANMDGKLDMKENLYHSKEVEKLFCNICITSIHIHPLPLLRFQTVPEKVLTVKDFQIMNTLICQQYVLPPHQNIMINLTPLAPIMRYKSEMKYLCQLWNSTHCFATSLNKLIDSEYNYLAASLMKLMEKVF